VGTKEPHPRLVAQMDRAPIYREHAAYCLMLAMRAKTDTSKLLWLDISDHWLSLASIAERTRAKEDHAKGREPVKLRNLRS
jgi:hypothetical protein